VAGGAVTDTPYDDLAAVYDWLVPDGMETPEGAAAAFADALPPSGRVLDCAAGTGLLAVGLAQRGYEVVATDASPGMVERAAALAEERGVDVATDVRRWEELGGIGEFDAVLCVGNSIVHAPGRAARFAAFAGMAGALRPGGTLLVTSRNWEAHREMTGGLHVEDQVVERPGGRAVVIRGWGTPVWDEPVRLDVAVAVLEDSGRVRTVAERLEVWPFRHQDLEEDLVAAGLDPAGSTWAPDVPRYLVTAILR
jgi:SAM-dependent methyltransferase